MVYLLYCVATDWPAFINPLCLTQSSSLQAFLFLLNPVNHISILHLTHVEHFAAMTKGGSRRVIAWPHSGPLTRTVTPTAAQTLLSVSRHTLAPFWWQSTLTSCCPSTPPNTCTSTLTDSWASCHRTSLPLPTTASSTCGATERTSAVSSGLSALATQGQEETWDCDCDFEMWLEIGVISPVYSVEFRNKYVVGT